MRAKLVVVLLLIGYHVWCGKLLVDFKRDRNAKGHVWYRWFNEVPVVLLLAGVVLVVVKPF
jgi:putative membrane protein